MPADDVLLTKQSVVDAAQRAFRTGLQTNIGGNLSARVPSGEACVIKATGVGFAECTIENLCVVGLDGQVREGGQPTSDVAIHLAIYRMRPDVHGIAHAHPPWVTGWAAASIAPPHVTVTADAKLGSVPMIPLAAGGLTQTDAEIVAMMGAGGPRGAILEKHGAITCGRSILEAMHLLELIEENAHIAARISTEASLSWSNSAANGGLSTYDEAVGYEIPNPAAQTLSPIAGGYQCLSPQWTEVTVNPLIGAPNLPSQMYTRTASLGATYAQAYGLVRSNGNAQCDWHIDGQQFRAVYLGINAPPSPLHTGVVYEPGGLPNRVVPATMAMWFRGSVPVVPTDTTPPTITVEVNGTLGANAWYTSDVLVTWTVTDDESTATTTDCEATSVIVDTVGLTLTCSAESEGGSASESVTIKRDATSPTIVGSRSPAGNGNGWNNTPVAVTFACDDTTSGVASCVGDTTVTTEGAGQSVSGTVTDLAGNTAAATVSDINIDTTPPVVSCSATPSLLWPPNHKMVPVDVVVDVEGGSGFTLLSATSNEPDNGLGDGDTANDIQGFDVGQADTSGLLRAERSGTGAGRVYSLVYEGVDLAGNTATCTTTVTVPHDRRGNNSGRGGR